MIRERIIEGLSSRLREALRSINRDSTLKTDQQRLERGNEILAATEREADRPYGIKPSELYFSIYKNAGTEGFKTLAMQQLHTNMPSDPAIQRELGDLIVQAFTGVDSEGRKVDQRLPSNNRLRQEFIGASLVRYTGSQVEDPIISLDSILGPVLDYVRNEYSPPTRPDGTPTQTQTQNNLTHQADSLASIARFYVTYNDDGIKTVLEENIDKIYSLQEQAIEELKGIKITSEEDKKNVEQTKRFIYGHVMEHLAEVMEVAAESKNEQLIEFLIERGVYKKFRKLDEEKPEGILEPDNRSRYYDQAIQFVRAARKVGYSLSIKSGELQNPAN